MDELEKAIAIISAASGAEATVVAERLKSDAASQAVAIELFEPKYKEQRDQGHRTATMKERKAVESAFKAAGIEDISVEALPAAIAAAKAKGMEESGKTITLDQAMNVPEVKQKFNELTASIDQKVLAGRQEERKAFEKEKSDFELGKLTSRKASLAEAEVAALNLNYGGDDKLATTRRQKLVKELALLPTVEVNGQLFKADANGDVDTAGLGFPVPYAEYVRQEATLAYDPPLSTPKQSPDVKDKDVAKDAQADSPFKEYKGEVPKTEDAVLAIRNDQSLSLAARKEVTAYWEAEKAK